jgi:nucleotide-binding universal stress UspA family protein
MPAQEDNPHPLIIAGVDGSPASLSALRWAIRQAGLTGAAVDAVIAWQYPASTSGYGWAMAAMDPRDDFAEVAGKTVADAISNTLDPGSDVRVHPHVAEGITAQVLLDASAGADLLVVGSRGHGGFAGALLGSVKPALRPARAMPCRRHPRPGPGLMTTAGRPPRGRAPGRPVLRGPARQARTSPASAATHATSPSPASQPAD